MTVSMGDVPASGIGSFELIRTGSMTHATSFDTRLVELTFTVNPANPSEYFVTLPGRADAAPPGWYMLFALSGLGAPSVARFVRVHP